MSCNSIDKNVVINEFNKYLFEFINYILLINKDFELQMYKKIAKKSIKLNKAILIENFIIHCLKYKNEVSNKDINFFIKLSISKSDNSNFIKIMKFNNFIKSIDNDKVDNVFTYLNLLCNYSEIYFNLLYSKVK